MTETRTGFDYEELDSETRALVRQRTGEIKKLTCRVAQDIVAIGLKLIEVKATIGHGHFREWLLCEFEWTERTAQRFMSVADAFKSDKLSDLRIAASALYLFAAPSTPNSAREEALDRARNGETITHSDAQTIKAVHTQHEIEDFPDVLTRAFAVERETKKWVNTAYQKTMTIKGAHTARDVATALNPEQLDKIRAMVEFLQEVDQIASDLYVGVETGG